MPTLDPLGQILLPDRVLILFAEFLGVAPHPLKVELKFLVHSINKDGACVLLIQSLGTAHRETTAVSAGQGGVQCEYDGLAVCTADGGGHNIALCKWVIRQLGVVVIRGVFVHPARL